jgi:DmsE family decaheme c-type cytochrome
MDNLIFVELPRLAALNEPVAARSSGPRIGRRWLQKILPVLLGGMLLLPAQTLRAATLDDPGEIRARLAAYVQELGAVPSSLTGTEPSAAVPTAATSRSPEAALPQPGATMTGDLSDDPYAELRAYAQSLPPASGAVRTAQADQPGKPKAGGDKPKASGKAKASDPPRTIGKAESADEATFVGSQVCLGCHATISTAFADTVMGKIFKNPRNAQERGGCETCHGAGSAHVKAGGGRGVGGIISFRYNDPTHTVEETNAICLSCHNRRNQTYWMGSTHEQRQVACTNCHQVMQRVSPRFQLAKSTELEVCFQCHKEKRAKIMLSAHMPLAEGKMTCSSCHNPHGSSTEKMLVADSINDVCYKCHADKRGPFLWDHPPVRENCLNCHDAHGTANEYMLTVARPRLCQQCHTQGHGIPGSPTSRFALGNSCQNCHSEIHGSNSPSGPRFQR